MRDVLATLEKLPEKCAAVIEDQAVFIRRGAREAGPAFIGVDQVDQWNADRGITPAQSQAMVIGLMLGWDCDGADPDVRSQELGVEEEVGPFSYTFTAAIALEVKITANTAEQATRTAHAELKGLLRPGWVLECLDLIETTDPR